MSQLNRYEFVGSFLRPERLKEARKNYELNNITKEELTKVEDECIVELVNKLKELGYHTITDGEFRRSTWHLDFMWGFNGVEHKKTVDGNQTFDDVNLQLIGKRTGRRFKMSDKVKIKVSAASKREKTIDFQIVGMKSNKKKKKTVIINKRRDKKPKQKFKRKRR